MLLKDSCSELVPRQLLQRSSWSRGARIVRQDNKIGGPEGYNRWFQSVEQVFLNFTTGVPEVYNW